MGVQDYCVAKYNILRERGFENDIEFLTIDQLPLNQFDGFLLSDLPTRKWLNKLKSFDVPMFLITEECPSVSGLEFCEYPFDLFEIVFTWADSLIEKNRKKFREIGIHSFISDVDYDSDTERPIDFVLINSNKTSNHSLAQYELRKDVINFFEKSGMQNFNLYGQRWDRKCFPLNTRWGRFLNARIWNWVFKQTAPICYKGVLDSKFPVLCDAQFSFCIENASGPRGYITEKIFESFYCGCIPIFYGDSKVLEMFPRDLFVFGSGFQDIGSVVEHCLGLSVEQRRYKRSQIRSFVRSPEFIRNYGSSKFCSTVIEGISSVI